MIGLSTGARLFSAVVFIICFIWMEYEIYREIYRSRHHYDKPFRTFGAMTIVCFLILLVILWVVMNVNTSYVVLD